MQPVLSKRLDLRAVGHDEQIGEAVPREQYEPLQIRACIRDPPVAQRELRPFACGAPLTRKSGGTRQRQRLRVPEDDARTLRGRQLEQRTRRAWIPPRRAPDQEELRATARDRLVLDPLRRVAVGGERGRELVVAATREQPREDEGGSL
jgi:hypothetical protein